MSAAREHGLPAVAAPRVGVPWTLVALATLLGAVLVGLVVGPVPIGVGEIARSALAHVPFLNVATPLDAAQEAIVWELRFPRVVLGALVGGMLALSGASYQGVFRNPLADPYLLGVAAGAGFGATLVIAYGPAGVDGFVLPLASFAGAIAAVVAAYLIGRSVGGGRTTATLILAGVTVAAFLTAAQVFVQQQNSDTLNEVYAWLLGGLTTAGWEVRDRDGRAEARPGRDAEQVRIGERVPEDALVRGPCDREHRADERGEDDPRHADLPQDGLLRR